MIIFRRFFRKKELPAVELVQLEALENKLGYAFKDVTLLKRSLSHKSYANEKRIDATNHNERLEFLGDAVLELSVSDLLIHRFPDLREGDMSKIRASLVNETALAEQARQLGLGDYIYLGKGEEQCSGREKNSLLADAFEALLGAIYLDGGYKKVFPIIRDLILPDLLRAGTEDISRDYKTKLQEDVQNRFKEAPEYRLISESGPDHAKVFEIHLFIRGTKVAEGRGKSKKQAEQSAAQIAVTQIEVELAATKGAS